MFWHNVKAELFEQGNIETITPKTVKGQAPRTICLNCLVGLILSA